MLLLVCFLSTCHVDPSPVIMVDMYSCLRSSGTGHSVGNTSHRNTSPIGWMRCLGYVCKLQMFNYSTIVAFTYTYIYSTAHHSNIIRVGYIFSPVNNLVNGCDM